MNKFLERYKVRITTLAPVYIGSGSSLTKKEYVYDPNEHKIFVLNFGKVFSEIKTGKAARELRKYFMNNSKDGLKDFLDKQDITIKSEWIETEYSVEEAESVFANSNYKGISLFIKDAYGKPYIPGSSLKGALRTALLKYEIANNKEEFAHFTTEIPEMIEKTEQRNVKKKLSSYSKQIEEQSFLVELEAKRRDGKKANYDVLKGLIVSDSKPLAIECLTLCQKIDRKQDAKENELPILRECIKTGTEVEFQLTFDRVYFKKSLEDIKQAIQYSYSSLRSWVEDFLPNELDETFSADCIYLGGGVGYVSKTFTYDLMNKETARDIVAKCIPKPGEKGRYGDTFVPRTIKKTSTDGEYYDMGLCKIEFERMD